MTSPGYQVPVASYFRRYYGEAAKASEINKGIILRKRSVGDKERGELYTGRSIYHRSSAMLS